MHTGDHSTSCRLSIISLVQKYKKKERDKIIIIQEHFTKCKIKQVNKSNNTNISYKSLTNLNSKVVDDLNFVDIIYRCFRNIQFFFFFFFVTIVVFNRELLFQQYYVFLFKLQQYVQAQGDLYIVLKYLKASWS